MHPLINGDPMMEKLPQGSASEAAQPAICLLGRLKAIMMVARLTLVLEWAWGNRSHPSIEPIRTRYVREPLRFLQLLCWRGFAPFNWCWEPVWERVRHGSWRGRLRGGNQKPNDLAECKWR